MEKKANISNHNYYQSSLSCENKSPLFFKPFIQPKLTINNPNDKYENEADAIAEKVMRMQQPFIQAKPLTVTTLQRKCAACDDEDKAQRKEMNGEETNADNNLENYIGSLNGSGQPLPNVVRNFYEPRFGYDFSNVKVHTDNVAAKSAQSLNALAYTNGNNIVFNDGQYSPVTDNGKRLLGHELTHVVQQGNKTVNSLQRQTTTAPLNIQAQEATLKKAFKAIRTAVDAATPGDKMAQTKIEKLIQEFAKGFAEYKPSMPRFWVEPEFGINDEYWRYANVYSKSEATIIAARLQLIGMPRQSAIMYNFGKPYSMIGVFPLDQPDQFNRAFIDATLERIDLSSLTNQNASLDTLLSSFRFIVHKISQLDVKKLEADKKYASFFGPEYKITDFAFFSEWPYYLSLMGHLGKLYGGMQQVIQNQFDKIITDLNSTGQAPSLPVVFQMLEKIEKGIPPKTTFSVPSATFKNFDPAQSTAAVTKTDFTAKHRQHVDVFDKSSKPASVKIEFYDKDQKEGPEKFMPIREIHQVRYIQLRFIRSFYGLDMKGIKVQGKQGPADLMPGKKNFDLFSLDDWKVFLDAKYDDLINNQQKKPADAFITIIRMLESYLNAFTIHTPYNIEDKGDNYLTKTFPRALTGQLIQDCGVYALKIIYLLSLLATRLKLKLQYIMLPNHVGLIIRGDQTPVVFVHNNMFTIIPVSESQFNDLSKENKETILSKRDLEFYEKSSKAKQESDFIITIDKQKQDWLKYTKDNKITGPATEKQFMAEKAATLFVNSVDMPFAVIDVNEKDYNPKLKNDKIKKNLWAQYERISKDTNLFDRKATAKEFSSTYQFHLRYLNITVAEKNFHNNTLLPFWNFTAKKKWETLVAGLKAKEKAKDIKGYSELIKLYRQQFISDVQNIINAYQPILKEKENIQNVIKEKDPNPLQKGVEKTVGERSAGEPWRVAFNTHLDNLKMRMDNINANTETLNTGTDITPAFATEADNLKYLP